MESKSCCKLSWNRADTVGVLGFIVTNLPFGLFMVLFASWAVLTCWNILLTIWKGIVEFRLKNVRQSVSTRMNKIPLLEKMDSQISCCLLIIPPRQVSTCPYFCPRNLPRCTKLGLHSVWSRIPRNSFLVLSIIRSTRDCNGIFLRRRDPLLWENCSRRREDEEYRLVSSRLSVSPVDYPAYQN